MDDFRLLYTLKWRNIHTTFSEFSELLQLAKAIGIKNIHKEIRQPALREKLKENRDWIDLAKREMEWLDNSKAHLAYLGGKNYPSALQQQKYPPLLLTYWGSPAWMERPSIGVVGSRRPNQLSTNWLESELPAFLMNTNVNVVSGGARGIDQQAHSICLRNNCPTICFLPSGLRRPYPSNISQWTESIVAQKGAVISQFSPFSEVYKSNFFYRNELIVQLSSLIFIVEAYAKSGSMLTAQLALRANKEIVTLPCAPSQEFGHGNLNLIFDGAEWVRDSSDLAILWKRTELSTRFFQ